jgi:filamentous hemagglutinin family protein
MIVALLLAAGASTYGAGGVVLDGKLGPSGPLSGPNYNITGDLGRTVGNNLFHSFAQFNLEAGDVATFSGPANVQNILSRVTGGSASSIDGTIRSSIAGANFFLINPAGVVFGPNAALDVSGAFAASTANYLKLANGARFVAALDADDSMLSTDPVVAFGFLNGASGSVRVEGPLQAQEGKPLTVVGGDISVEGGQLVAPNGLVNLVSAKAAGEVTIDPATAAVDARSIGVQGRIEVNNAASVNVSGQGGGQVVIRGGRLVVEGAGTSVKAETLGAQDGRGIDIALTDGLEVRNGGLVTTSTSGAGKGGDITITAPSVVLQGDSFENTARITSETFSQAASGTGGAITLDADSLTLNAAAEISTSTFGPANAGTIDVTASSVRLTGSDFALTQIIANANPLVGDGGTGGDIVIDADSIEITSGAQLTAITLGSGNAGLIDIQTPSLTLRGGGIGVTTAFTGNGGAVRIDGGTVTMDEMNGFPAVIAALTTGDGQGGSIMLDLTGPLQLLNGSFISADTQGANDGGSINIHAQEVNLDTAASVRSASLASGRAGEISINADNSILLNGNSFISTSAPNSSGGNIALSAGSEIQLDQSEITAQAGPGGGGNIMVTAPSQVYLLDSTFNAQAVGDGGNLSIINPVFFILNNGALISKSSSANGGNITILSDYFFQSASTIDASAPFGLPGTVSVSAPEVDLSGSLLGLPSNLLGAETQLRPDCGVRLTGNISSFIVLGRGGLPIEPGGFVPSGMVPPSEEGKRKNAE